MRECLWLLSAGVGCNRGPTWAHNPKVAGSNPAPQPKKPKGYGSRAVTLLASSLGFEPNGPRESLRRAELSAPLARAGDASPLQRAQRAESAAVISRLLQLRAHQALGTGPDPRDVQVFKCSAPGRIVAPPIRWSALHAGINASAASSNFERAIDD